MDQVRRAFPLVWTACLALRANGNVTEERVGALVDNEDIKNTWKNENLFLCTEENNNLHEQSELYCEAFLSPRWSVLQVEYMSMSPPVIRFHRFGTDRMLSDFKRRFNGSGDVEHQRVEGASYSKGHRGRVADGLWLEHYEECVQELFGKIQKSLRVNPAIAENFLILKYAKYGHYAPHYDHLFPMTKDYDDGWFEFFGNRMATALFIVETAVRGGGTVFPRLGFTIRPEPGDLLFWFNADSNDKREYNSLHAACPVEVGEKMAVSLWIRGNFQDALQSSLAGPPYSARSISRRFGQLKSQPQFDTRPQIPREYGGYWDEEDVDSEVDEGDVDYD